MKFVLINLSSILIGYALWVNFSYVFSPFSQTKYEIVIEKDTTVPSGQGYWKHRPGQFENKRYNATYSINSKGLRGPEFAPKKDGPAKRIIALGASSTMGIESNDDETWPSRLEYYLKGQEANIEVINSGIGGLAGRNHLAMLKNEILNYEPDIILYYEGYNDHSTSAFERYPGPALFGAGRVAFLKIWGIFKKIQLRYFALKLFNIDIENFLPWPNNWRPTYHSHLEQMIALAQKNNIEFVIVSQVLDYSPDYFDFLASSHQKGSYPLGEAVNYFSVTQNDWHSFMRQFDILAIQNALAQKYKLQKIDVHKSFADAPATDKPLFYDCVHLTPAGNDLLAISIADHLQSANF